MFDNTGDVDGASGLIERCLEVDQTSSDSHILMAQVSVARQTGDLCDSHIIMAQVTGH